MGAAPGVTIADVSGAELIIVLVVVASFWLGGLGFWWVTARSRRRAALAPMSAPAGWHADPTARFELRYWDGARWTEHVSTSGNTATDPMP